MTRAILLAAGRGSRMGTRTSEMPKCFVEVLGKPLIEWQLAELRKSGVQNIGIVTGYKGESFEQFPVTKFVNPQWEKTNMVSSLLQARDWLTQGDTLICYSDILFSADTVRTICKAPGDIVVPFNSEWLPVWKARFENPLDDLETFKLDSAGKLREIGKKPKTLTEIDGQYMGLLKFTEKGWASIQEFLSKISDSEIAGMHMTGLLNLLISSRYEISTCKIEGNWFEFDSQNDIRAFNEFREHFSEFLSLPAV